MGAPSKSDIDWREDEELQNSSSEIEGDGEVAIDGGIQSIH